MKSSSAVILTLLGIAGGFIAGRNSANSSEGAPTQSAVKTIRTGNERSLTSVPGEPADKALSPEERENKLWAGLSDPSDARRRLTWGLLLEKMTAADAPRIKARLEHMVREGESIKGEVEDFWDRWGELDGAEAMKAVMAEGTPSMALREAAMAGWVRTNSPAALAWLAAEGPDLPGRDSIVRGVVQSLARADSQKALQFLSGSLKPGEQANLTREAVWGAIYAKGIPGAVPFMESLAGTSGISTAGKNDALMVFLTGCLRGYPGEFQQVLTTSRGQPWFEASVVDSAFARAATNGNPSTVLESVPLLQNATAKEQVISVAVSRWMDLEPSTVGNWLNAHKDHPDYNAITAQYAVSVKDLDPAAAGRWAGTITDPAKRADVLGKLQPRPAEDKAVPH